jgi:hypothetical protein
VTVYVAGVSEHDDIEATAEAFSAELPMLTGAVLPAVAEKDTDPVGVPCVAFTVAVKVTQERYVLEAGLAVTVVLVAIAFTVCVCCSLLLSYAVVPA